jgi:hypothetical protein
VEANVGEHLLRMSLELLGEAIGVPWLRQVEVPQIEARKHQGVGGQLNQRKVYRYAIRHTGNQPLMALTN